MSFINTIHRVIHSFMNKRDKKYELLFNYQSYLAVRRCAVIRPKVLVVEDHVDIQDIYRWCLGHLADVVVVGNISSAMDELRDQGFSLVILDGNVPLREAGPFGTTIELAQHISSSVNVPMLSASGSDELNNILVSKGCMRADKLTAVDEAKKFLRTIH